MYPKEHEIRVVWGKLHITLIVFTTLLVWPSFFYFNPISAFKLSKLLSVLGLFIDVIGVVIASLETPYYGSFHDGGAIEHKRAAVESAYFRVGMLLIGLGFLLQALGTLV